MSLDVFYPQDIRRILEALASSGELRGPEYQRALRDVALAFGVELSWRNERLSWTVIDAPVVALERGTR